MDDELPTTTPAPGWADHPSMASRTWLEAASHLCINKDGSQLHAKLAKVMAAMGNIEERGRNREQGYEYLTSEDVFNEVRVRLGAEGITLIQEYVEIIDRSERTTRSNNIMFSVLVLFRFVLTDAASGEREEYLFPGVGEDTGDKWLSKASTAAAKWFIRRLLMISAGEDEDSDATQPEPTEATSGVRGGGSGGAKREAKPERAKPKGRVVSEAQVKRLWAIARSNDVSRETVHRLVWLATQARSDSSEDLTAGKDGEYDKVVGWIENYGKYQDVYEETMDKWEAEHPPPERATPVQKSLPPVDESDQGVSDLPEYPEPEAADDEPHEADDIPF